MGNSMEASPIRDKGKPKQGELAEEDITTGVWTEEI